MKSKKYLRHEVEVESITYDDKDKVFVVEYSIYNLRGEHILTDTARLEHTTDGTELYFDAMEKLKKLLKDNKYETKIKN
jgi:hypothetical protein